ncbi:MAG: hypothetical protein BGO77_03740 [Caedibacter sp. 37-49]|nr:MAG: hypothetical protein BGO77_03740 [Caedibacter sp. 37-49]
MKNSYALQEVNFIHPQLHEEVDLRAHEKKLKEARYLTLPLEEMLELLYQLNEFELGRSLLINRRFTGYWRAYAILHAPHMSLKHPLENWLINVAPISLAIREVFKNFQTEVQKRLRNAMSLSAIPCGLMNTFLSLNYKNINNVKLVGIDSDTETINYAKQNVAMQGFTGSVSFHQKDAWNLGDNYEKYDLIINHGLNVYEYDEQRVKSLYNELYKVLNNKGTLLVSFFTPSPALSDDSTWRNFDPYAVKKQKAIFADIINSKWQAYRTEGQTRSYLEAVGFKIKEVIYDHQGMAPIVIAEK